MTSNDGKPNPQRPRGANEPVDFGAFVSSSVQESANKLKGDGSHQHQQPAAAPPPQKRAGGERSVERSRDSSYWRRRAAGSTEPAARETAPTKPARGASRRYLPADEPGHDDHDFDDHDDDGGGGFGGFINSVMSGDGDDGKRNRLIAIILALLLLALLVWGVFALLGDDGGDDTDTQTTPVPTEVIDTPSTPADGVTDLTGDSTPEAPETEEPDIPRGGDNQRGDEDSGPDLRPTEIAFENLTSEVARECKGHCLVRMEGPDQQKALDEAKARISWGEEEISWLVVTPTQAEVLDRTHTLTMVLPNEPETYDLYLIKTPADHNDRAVIDPYATIIDYTGRYYLAQWSSVPAVVKPVTDWGYAVFKIAPRQPSFASEPGVLGPAKDTDGWTVASNIDQANVEQHMDQLVHMGELDNSGWGTRYYTYPGNQIAADYLFQELESYGFTVWYEDFIMWDGYLLVNVVAEIKGSDPSKAYALMAHFDTNNITNTRIAPGADDNASGLVTVLEVARVLSQYELKHTLHITFVNAEEVGIIGSNAWARNAVRTGVPIEGVFNIDSVGSIRNRPYIITNSDARSAWMQQMMTRVNSEYGLQETLQHHQTDKIVADDNFVRSEGLEAIMVARELYEENLYHHTVEDIPANTSIPGVVDTVRIILIIMWELTG